MLTICSRRVVPLLSLLFGGCTLDKSCLGLFYLLSLYLLVAMCLGQITVLPLEDDRLAANPSVDVEHSCGFCLRVTLSTVLVVTHGIFSVGMVHFLGSLDHVKVVRFLLIASEVFDLGTETRDIVELELPFGLENTCCCSSIFLASCCLCGLCLFTITVFILIFLIVMVGFIRCPSHLDGDKLECAVGLDTLPSQKERKVVNHAVSVLASHELDQFRGLFAKRQGVNLLDFVSFLNFRSRGDLCLLNLNQM